MGYLFLPSHLEGGANEHLLLHLEHLLQKVRGEGKGEEGEERGGDGEGGLVKKKYLILNIFLFFYLFIFFIFFIFIFVYFFKN